MNTLLLAQDTWDLITDAEGGIAMASDPYAIAQDVASAVRLFFGELWYDTTKGIPYFEEILGKRPPLQYVKTRVELAALTVPQVARARCVFVTFKNRQLTGQIQVIDQNGVTANVNF